jgi:hypothetical protein
MLIQAVNVVAGFTLAIPLFGKNAPALQKWHDAARVPLGIVTLVVGLVNLVSRANILSIPFFNGGYPQTIAAIVAGLLLARSKLGNRLDELEPYEAYVGIAVFALGLYALI